MTAQALRIALALCALTLAQAALAGGSIGGMTVETFNRVAVCRNLTSGDAVTIPGLAGAPQWDCTSAGLTAQAGDIVLQAVNGFAFCPGGTCAIGGSVSGVEGSFALCRNTTTGQSQIIPLNGQSSWNCGKAGLAASTGDRVQQLVRGTVAGGPLPDCTITFDGSCPDTQSQCGASFEGGNGCIVAGLPFCYSTGLFGYEIPGGQMLTITFDGDLEALDVFFSVGGANGAGTMTFFDAAGEQVDKPLAAIGNCAAAMPDSLRVDFSRPVRTIVVESAGPDSVFLDTFNVNPSP